MFVVIHNLRLQAKGEEVDYPNVNVINLPYEINVSLCQRKGEEVKLPPNHVNVVYERPLLVFSTYPVAFSTLAN